MTAAADDPPFAYVPGQTARHEDGRFDAIRDTAKPGVDEAALAQCDAFQTGLRYLRDGYFWEAHEVLEPVWMLCPPNSPSRAVVQGLIQLANARLKQKMGKHKAAIRLYMIARGHFEQAQGGKVMGVTTGSVLAEIDATLVQMNVQYNA